MAEGFRSDAEILFDYAYRARHGISDAPLPENNFSVSQGPWLVLDAEDASLVGRVFQWARKQGWNGKWVVAEDQDEKVSYYDVLNIRKENDDAVQERPISPETHG